MDKFDREILSILVENGKIQLSELSKMTDLSVSSCQRRIKNLEETGIISKYQAVVNEKAVGKGFQALVFISLAQATNEKIGEFERALVNIPAITSAHRIFGEQDYVLRVATTDLSDYQQVYDTQLSTLPYIRKIETTLLMKEIVPVRLCLDQ